MSEVGPSLSEISPKTNSNPPAEDILEKNSLTTSPKKRVRLPNLVIRTVNRLAERITEKDNQSVPEHLTARETTEYTSLNDFTDSIDILVDVRDLSRRQQKALLSKLENSDKLVTFLLTTKATAYYGLKTLSWLLFLPDRIGFPIPQAGPVLGRITAKHLTEIETIIKTDVFARAGGMEVVGALARYGDKHHHQTALAILSENLKLALNTNEIYDYGTILDTLLAYGNDEQVSSAETLVNRVLDNQSLYENAEQALKSVSLPETPRKLINWLFSHGRNETSQLAGRKEKLTSNYIGRLGLDSKSVISLWTGDLNRENPEYDYNIKRNVDRINELEHLHPGICGILNKQFGIIFFGRYSKDFLLDQFKNRDNKQVPYGVIANPYTDWNGAFYSNSGLFDKLRSDLAENGWLIRITEVGDKLGLVRTVNSLRHNYGPISFGILGGHGKPESIQFGNNLGDYLTLQDLKRKGASTLSLAFSQDAPIVFNSCSTGVEEGLGQETSRLYDTQTHAPNTETSIKSIDVTFDQSGKLQLSVTYNKDNSSVLFKTGIKIE